MSHNRVLWVLQWVFGLYFIAIGVMHFVVPDGLPEMMSWMYELSDTLHTVAGIAEILGGIGLIRPSLTRMQPRLTVFAAIGLALVMLGAIAWHLNRGETSNVAVNVLNVLVMAYIAYGRSRLAPLEAKTA